MKRLIGLGSIFIFGQAVEASTRVEQYRHKERIEVLSVTTSIIEAVDEPTVLRSTPVHLEEGVESDEVLYEELIYSDDKLPTFYEIYRGSNIRDRLKKPEETEMRELIIQGASQNRIDLTILGDGYTESEREKFFEDAQRMTDDLFKAQAFSSYLPLFNVRAIFVASNESGLTDTVKKDTAFDLYRSPAGSKRGIMPGDTDAIEAALSVPPESDYPIIIANDDYYGGLGGRYAISTRSLQSGSMVLRHELGHNFGDVGEEYDGGGVYRGANSSRTTNVPWKHWCQNQSVDVYETKFLSGAYVWKNLAEGSHSSEFEMPEPNEAGPYSLFIKMSGVGWSDPQTVQLLLNGNETDYYGLFTDDRSFFFARPNNPQPGRYEMIVQELKSDGDNVLAYAHAFANPADYDYTAHKIGAFSTFNSSGSKSYRPTHEFCAMRDMRADYFCSPDKENFWIQFLKRIRPIDSLTIQDRAVDLTTLNVHEMKISWFRKVSDTQWDEIPELKGQRRWLAPKDWKGNFKVDVQFITPEVRKPTKRFKDSQTFSL